MSEFPLLDSLSKNISDKDLSYAQKRSFLEKIEKIDKEGYELIYALIKMYQITYEDNTGFSLPYNSKHVENDGIVFNLAELPNNLKQILYKFIGKHLKKMKEDNNN